MIGGMAADPSSLSAISPEYAMTLAKMGIGGSRRAPQNVGEGLTYIGEKINEAAWRNVLLKSMQDKDAKETASWNAYLGMGAGGGSPAPGGMAAGPSPTPAPAAPQPSRTFTPEPAYQSAPQARPAIMGGAVPGGMAASPDAQPSPASLMMRPTAPAPQNNVPGGMAAPAPAEPSVPGWATAPRQAAQPTAAPAQPTSPASSIPSPDVWYGQKMDELRGRMRGIDPKSAAGQQAIAEYRALQQAQLSHQSPQGQLEWQKTLRDLEAPKTKIQAVKDGEQLVSVDERTGKATQIYNGDSTSQNLPGKVSGGLNNLARIPGEVGSSTFDSSVGPLRGSDNLNYGASPIAKVWGSFTNWLTGDGKANSTEVRSRIAGDSEALAATLKPLIRKPGEGAWSDADQARLNALVGNLATSNDAAEYQRNLEGVRQRVMSNFGIQLPPIQGTPQAPAKPGGGQARYVAEGPNGQRIYSDDGQSWRDKP